MPRTIAYQAVTERLEILGEDGTIDRSLAPDLSSAQLVALYENMVTMRLFDDKALKMQRQGRMGTWGSLKGQEAAQAGVVMAMGPEDWVVPSFREHGVLLLRGVPGHLIYAFWKGDERGAAIDRSHYCLPPSVPVASQLIHGAGMGWAFKLRAEPVVAFAFAGDGATSEGDFHEALNFAGVFQTNTVFVIQNNQWAISTPAASQTRAETLAQKAHAYGIPGLQVDGNDVLAVYAATKEAVDRARSGGGPSLIEAKTYRLGDHTTADDAGRYRDADDVAAWSARDPLVRMSTFLKRKRLWSARKEEALLEAVAARVEAEVKALESMPEAPVSDIFNSMYAELPESLVEQREGLERILAQEVS